MKQSLLIIAVIVGMMQAAPMESSARTGGVDLVEPDVQDISLTYYGGGMHIMGANNQMVTIYNLAGVAVRNFRVEGQDKRFNLSLTDGVYIVKVGKSFTRKIVVRR